MAPLHITKHHSDQTVAFGLNRLYFAVAARHPQQRLWEARFEDGIAISYRNHDRIQKGIERALDEPLNVVTDPGLLPPHQFLPVWCRQSQLDSWTFRVGRLTIGRLTEQTLIVPFAGEQWGARHVTLGAARYLVAQHIHVESGGLLSARVILEHPAPLKDMLADPDSGTALERLLTDNDILRAFGMPPALWEQVVPSLEPLSHKADGSPLYLPSEVARSITTSAAKDDGNVPVMEFDPFCTEFTFVPKDQFKGQVLRDLENRLEVMVVDDKGTELIDDMQGIAALKEIVKGLKAGCEASAEDVKSQRPPKWYHGKNEDHPSEFPFGPVCGNQKDLASAIDGKPDGRHLMYKARNGVVWVRRRHRTCYEVWFKIKQDCQRVSEKMSHGSKPQG